MTRNYLGTMILSYLFVALGVSGQADEFNNQEPSFVLTTQAGWSIASAEVLANVNRMSFSSAVAHAKQKGIEATKETVDSRILLISSKVKLGTPGDNPNLIVAREKSWSDEYEKTGKGYLKLMQDRVALLQAPTKFIGEVRELKIGSSVFFYQDAVNTLVPNAKTKQRYICGFLGEHYVYFVFSHNGTADPDFTKMMNVVKSFRPKS